MSSFRFVFEFVSGIFCIFHLLFSKSCPNRQFKPKSNSIFQQLEKCCLHNNAAHSSSNIHCVFSASTAVFGNKIYYGAHDTMGGYFSIMILSFFLKENQLYSERNVSTPQHKIIELIFSYLGSKSGIMGIYPPHGSYTLAVRAKSTLHINMNLRKNYVCHLRTCFAVLRFDIVNRIIFILFFAQLLPKRKISLRSFSLKKVPGSIVEICKG